MPLFSATRKRRLYELASTFLLDASVLIFVFVPHDVVIQFGRVGLSVRTLLQTWAAAALFFVLALIMAILGDEL
jgi:hypothetical protein